MPAMRALFATASMISITTMTARRSMGVTMRI
jgi:hypothetical protein